MSRRISNATKLKRGMGQGEGADYKAFIHPREFSNSGVSSIIPDWKTGRSVYCLSQGEAMYYRLLRWDDDNVDIREQFPLDNKLTVKIAEEAGIKHPRDDSYIMTTDLLVTRSDGSYKAYSVKTDRNLKERTKEILTIEYVYWQSLGIDFQMLYKEDANETLAENIALVTEFYDDGSVFDVYSALKHMIATKQVEVDMEHEIITNEFLEENLGGLINGRRH